MDKALSTSILRGRPWGGVGLLIKQELSKLVKFQKCEERFAIVAFEHLLLISVYMPSGNGQEVVDIITDLISMIESVIIQFPDHAIICGGDFNTDLITPSFKSLYSFIKTIYDGQQTCYL